MAKPAPVNMAQMFDPHTPAPITANVTPHWEAGRRYQLPHTGIVIEIECYIDGLPYTRTMIDRRTERLNLSP